MGYLEALIASERESCPPRHSHQGGMLALSKNRALHRPRSCGLHLVLVLNRFVDAWCLDRLVYLKVLDATPDSWWSQN